MTMNFEDPGDIVKITVTPYNIEPLDPQKRLRVLGGWLIEAVFDGINMYNHHTRLTAWLHQAQIMRKKYSIHEKYIDEIVLGVWARYQYVWKTELKPAIEAYQKEQEERKKRKL